MAEEEEEKNREQEQANDQNPWVRVNNNVDLDPNNYVGEKDMTRMRQSMIARKADITKAGGMDKL